MVSLPNLSSLRLAGAAGPNFRVPPQPPTGASVADIVANYSKLQDAEHELRVATNNANAMRSFTGRKEKTRQELECRARIDNAQNRALKFAAQMYNLQKALTDGDQQLLESKLVQAVSAADNKKGLVAGVIDAMIVERSDDYIERVVANAPNFYKTDLAAVMKRTLVWHLATKAVMSKKSRGNSIYRFVIDTYIKLLEGISGPLEVLQSPYHEGTLFTIPEDWIRQHLPEEVADETPSEQGRRVESAGR